MEEAKPIKPEKERRRAKPVAPKRSEGRSASSKYSPANISLWLRQWKNDRENWHFKSIALNEAVRLCLNRELMTKDDFDIFCEFFKTNKNQGVYKRMVAFCEEV